ADFGTDEVDGAIHVAGSAADARSLRDLDLAVDRRHGAVDGARAANADGAIDGRQIARAHIGAQPQAAVDRLRILYAGVVLDPDAAVDGFEPALHHRTGTYGDASAHGGAAVGAAAGIDPDAAVDVVAIRRYGQKER